MTRPAVVPEPAASKLYSEVMLDDSQVQTAAELVGDVLRAHSGQLRAFVQGRVPTAYVDEVLQTAAVRAVERAESLKDPTRVLPWLYRLHRNVIVDMLRKRASRERVVDPGTAPPDIASELPRELCQCSLIQAQRLNPAYARVLALVDVGETPVAEAAVILGISVNNVTVRLHRARKALREAMLHHCGVQSPRECLQCRCVSEGCCDA